MDNRLIFLYHDSVVTISGGTQKVKYAGDRKCQFKRVGSQSRQIHFGVKTRGVTRIFHGRVDTDTTLPRKSSHERYYYVRTVNRHRWVSREC